MLSFLAAWRSTRVLDDRKVGGADRSQSVVHALLSAKEQVPQEQLPPVLHRKIITRLEETRPLTPTAWDSWTVGAGRIAAAALVLLMLGAAVIWSTHTLGPRKADGPHDLAQDDPGAAPVVAASLIVPRAEPLVGAVRPRTAGWAERSDLSPAESRKVEQDAQQIAQTVLNALPVRQNDPR